MDCEESYGISWFSYHNQNQGNIFWSKFASSPTTLWFGRFLGSLATQYHSLGKKHPELLWKTSFPQKKWLPKTQKLHWIPASKKRMISPWQNQRFSPAFFFLKGKFGILGKNPPTKGRTCIECCLFKASFLSGHFRIPVFLEDIFFRSQRFFFACLESGWLLVIVGRVFFWGWSIKEQEETNN